MYQPINQVRLRGFLTEPARLFVSRSGQPRIAFRMEVWIDDEKLPPKKAAGVDYFSVVAFGAQFLNLLPQLALEREVTLEGRLRSRDIDTDGRRVDAEGVVLETVSVAGIMIAPRGSIRPIFDIARKQCFLLQCIYLVGSQGLPAFYRTKDNRINSRYDSTADHQAVHTAASPA